MKQKIEIINKREFKKTGDNEYVFVRNNNYNLFDIANSAALAMHKAIIGICELDAVETAEREMKLSFRVPRAVQTYYIIYHLFTCCMLLDEDYEIKFYTKGNRKLKYGTSL